MKLKLHRPLVLFDLEATGIDPAKDRIVEISLLKVHPDGTEESKNWRLNPGIPIPAEASAIHGILDSDVADAPFFADVAEELFEWLQEVDLGGYNSNRFDIPMLVEEFLRVGLELPENRHQVDVMRIFMVMEKRTLEAAYRFYCGKTLDNAHAAEADTRATWEVLQAQLERYPDELEPGVEFLDRMGEDEDFVDNGRRMIYHNGVEVFHFGKHKGRPVEEVFRREPSYYDWMMKGDFAGHTKRKITAIWERIRKNGGS